MTTLTAGIKPTTGPPIQLGCQQKQERLIFSWIFAKTYWVVGIRSGTVSGISAAVVDPADASTVVVPNVASIPTVWCSYCLCCCLPDCCQCSSCEFMLLIFTLMLMASLVHRMLLAFLLFLTFLLILVLLLLPSMSTLVLMGSCCGWPPCILFLAPQLLRHNGEKWKIKRE